MKIAITGSAGVGKTTLATVLANRNNALLVKEQFDGFFNDDGGFLKSEQILQTRIVDVLNRKHEQVSSSVSVVSDRCPIDLFNLWLTRGFSRYGKETMALYKACRAYMETFDYVIVLPWGSIPLKQINVKQDKRVRVMNPWAQLHSHSSIIGLCHQWVLPRKLVPVPGQIKDQNLRVEYLQRKISMQ